MKKTVYSLVLSEDVVAEIDRLAYRSGTNRSGMINQIVAEYVSYVTPEMKRQQTLRRLEALLDGRDSFRVQLSQSDTHLALRSALDFKYNPTVRYGVELYRSMAADGSIGELRVTLRTQNASLLHYLTQFYRIWMHTEESFFGISAHGQIEDGGKYLRRLKLRSVSADVCVVDTGSEALGELIAAYIRTFDTALKAYFYHLNNPAAAMAEAERLYRAYLAQSAVVL